jgi:hypothetical protein
MGMFSEDDVYPAPEGVSEEKRAATIEKLERLRENYDQSLNAIRLKVLMSNQVQEPNIG